MADKFVQPRWAPIPGAMRHSGLGRRVIEEAVANGWIESSLVRKPGAKRGRRLINLESLDGWIRKGIGEKAELEELQAGAERRRAAAR